MTLDDFLTLPLPKRIAWLHSHEGPRGKLSHDRFAEVLGVPNRQTIIGWEKGTEPNRFYAAKLAEFSGTFPEWVFRRRESEEAAWEMFARRLGALEAAVAERPTRTEVQEGLDTLREAIHPAANPGSGETRSRREKG